MKTLNNTMTVEDLLMLPCFKDARVLCGKAGLVRPVSWAHILEVNDAQTLINGGELILTTGVSWGRRADLSVSFLKQLIDLNASGLCVELDTYVKTLPEAMIEIAEKHHFPIIVFHKKVRFIDITKEIYQNIYFPRDSSRYTQTLQKLWDNGVSDHEIIRMFKDKYNSGIASLWPEETNFTADQNHFEHIRAKGLHLISTHIPSSSALFMIWFDLFHDQTTFKSRLKEAISSLIEQKGPTLVFGTHFHSINHMKRSVITLKRTYQISDIFQKKGCIFYDDMHLEKVLFPILQDEQLSLLIEEYLKPVIKYDEANQSNLLKTLQTFLLCKCNKKETAERLFIVRQTLYHRLQKIRELIGDDFLEPEKRLLLELLIYAYFNHQSHFI